MKSRAENEKRILSERSFLMGRTINPRRLAPPLGEIGSPPEQPQRLIHSPRIDHDLAHSDISNPMFGETYDALGLFGLMARGEPQPSPMASSEETPDEDRGTSRTAVINELEEQLDHCLRLGHFVLATKIENTLRGIRDISNTSSEQKISSQSTDEEWLEIHQTT